MKHDLRKVPIVITWKSIEFTGLMLEDLIDIGLEEMCAISDELGL